jgi:hypothetical protein
MPNRFLDARKALEVFLFITEKEHDLRRVMKYLYFADKLHMDRYERFITGDYYVKMEQGPVPSGAYDIAKLVRGDEQYFEDRIVQLEPEKSLSFKHRYNFIPKRKPDLDYLSVSDIECLSETIEKLKTLTDLQLINLGHDEVAWKEANLNDRMDEEKIILSLPNGKKILEFMNAD